ncbi:DUF4279 domain-containing protein [Sorangium sp. So ce119]|uniref:DUF4279 domain-containing protein n=1 Tax=Sorangium sp. So ce119 TaxID=3133279 RepID=UPI003F6330F4
MSNDGQDFMESRRTPYNELYPTCERADATLRIYAECIHPQEITRRLAVEPDSVQVKGEVRVNSVGRARVIGVNGWFISSETKVSSKDLRHHLDWIIGAIYPVREALLKLQQTRGVKMDVSCVWWSAHGHGGPTLWPEQMRPLSDLGLECGFDVYFFGEDWQQVR